MNASSPARILLLSLLLPITWSAACSTEEGSEKRSLAGVVQRREAARVRTSPVVVREMVRTLTTTTNVQSQKEIQVFPRMSGNIIELLVEEGDRVEQGQALAVLDARDAQVMLDEAKMALREANEALPNAGLAKQEAMERFERARLTYDQAVRDVERNEKAGLISDNDLEKVKLTRDQAFRDQEAARIGHESSVQDEKAAETAIARAQLGVDRQELALTYTEILAPISGVIAKRAIKVGDSVGPGAHAFVLTDPDRLRAVIYRPQRELALFTTGIASNGHGADGAGAQSIDIRATAEALPGVEYKGHVEFLSPTIDTASGSFSITVRLEQPAEDAEKPRLLPGMLVRLSVVTERHSDALVVPKRALRREGDLSFLFVAREGKAHRIEVTEEFSDDESVEVLPLKPNALAEGDHVIVIGNRDLEEGSEIEVEPSADAAASKSAADPSAETLPAASGDGR